MFVPVPEKIRQQMGASESQWSDWRWQMQHRIETIPQLAEILSLSEEEQQGAQRAAEEFRWAITPYALTLIDVNDPNCPLRRQIVPSERECHDVLGEDDPLLEESHCPTPDMIHLYPDRVALCITSICQVYCRHCFRKRRTHQTPPANAFEQALGYLKEHTEIRDVLVTGGDPLMLSDKVLFDKLARLRELKHVQILRIGTRAPAMLPMRVTEELARGLADFHPLFVNVQFNHPRELTPEAIAALTRLADRGIPLGNQSVLLRGVNDSAEIMTELCHKLLMARVRPYYLFLPHLVKGTEHLRVPVEVGLEIIERMEGHTSGLAVPQFAADTPYGKVPLAPERLVRRDEESFTVRSFSNRLWVEKNPKE